MVLICSRISLDQIDMQYDILGYGSSSDQACGDAEVDQLRCRSSVPESLTRVFALIVGTSAGRAVFDGSRDAR